MNWNEIIFFGAFLVFVIIMLVIDLGVFNKKAHVISFKEAISWSIIWVGISIAFYFFLTKHGELLHGPQNIDEIRHLVDKYQHAIKIETSDYEAALVLYRNNLGLEYITGFLIEKALSIDNIFVIIMIFISFGVDQKYYHRILFWGILGAIVMRFIFIFLSAALIQQFAWILYIFGGLLIFTGLKMFISRNKEEKIDTENHYIVRLASKYFRVDRNYKGKNFFTRIEGKKYLTPLFIVLLVIEFSDVIFAVDSVPAIFAVTKDPYIVFFSNIFAIIGLRALFFVLSNIINYFQYLKIGLSVLLVFIGIKMLIHDWLKGIGFETIHSLYVVGGILIISMLASVLKPRKKEIIDPEEDFQ
ncbi:MAG: TerC family protein [Bacteroidales bacterium]|nr:TerC family protein [Bacteroidales bacterium]MCF8386923.1 TerC family protein [Bacteroidales bacterium]MCF8399350.1 TerC family protein [Bacteroidales bacterium]